MMLAGATCLLTLTHICYVLGQAHIMFATQIYRVVLHLSFSTGIMLISLVGCEDLIDYI